MPARSRSPGQDGDLAALNRVALGTQTVSVWKDARELGTATGEAAIALCDESGRRPRSQAPSEFETPGWQHRASILLDPIPITQDNLDVVLDAEWIDEGDPLPGRRGRLGRGCP